MAPQHTIIEFHDSYCRILVWQSGKGDHTLKADLRVALEARPTVEVSLQVPEPGMAAPATDNSAIAQKNGGAIRDSVKSAGIRVREAVAIVPKQWVNLRVVTLPSGDPTELAEMARFEAERHIPFDAERHIVSHHIARSEDIQGSQVVIAALDGPLAEEVTGTMDAAGITLTALDVSTSTLVNALVQSGQWNRTEDPTVAHVHIDETTTDINILHDGMPVFARSIALGAGRLVEPGGNIGEGAAAGGGLAGSLAAIDLMSAPHRHAGENGAIDINAAPGDAPSHEAAAWLNRLIQEIQRTYGYAHREFDCPPLTRVFVSGIGTALRNLNDVLRMVLEAETEELKVFGEHIRCGAETVEKQMPEGAYALAAGALVRDLRAEAVRINLLPAGYLRKHVQSRRKQSLLTTATLVVALIVCAFVFADQTMRERRRQLRFYQSQIAANEARTNELERKRTVIKLLKQNTSREGSALAVLDTISSWRILYLEDATRIALTEFNYVAQDYVKITGHARTHEDFNDFMAQLERSGLFARVLLENRGMMGAPNAPRERVVRFSLNCRFRRPAGETSETE